MDPDEQAPPPPEPRWPALLAILTSGLLYAALPRYLSVGPRWLFLMLICILELPAMISHWRGYHRTYQALGFVVSGVSTSFLLWSIGLLVANLPAHKESPVDMLVSAAILWISNILVFALWYWRLDAGGPTCRDRRAGHRQGAFLFPQMAIPHMVDAWSPRFVDYLFVAFNTSTAFSPTDTPVLDRWAKILCMLQSVISMGTIVLLAARAVNIM